MSDPYQEHGYDNRTDYLADLAKEYDVPSYVVMALADALGPNEDFDGLIIMLQDAAGMF